MNKSLNLKNYTEKKNLNYKFYLPWNVTFFRGLCLSEEAKKKYILSAAMEAKMRKILSVEGIFKLARSNKMIRDILFEQHHKNLLKICQTPKSSDCELLSFDNSLAKFQKDLESNENDFITMRILNILNKPARFMLNDD